MSEITTTYLGVPIIYLEGTNQWRIQDQNEFAPSLAEIKERISKKAKKDFKPHQAVLWSNIGPPHLCDVLSMWGDSQMRVEYVAYANGGKAKQLVNSDRIYPVTPHNVAILGDIEDAKKQIETLNAWIKSLSAKLSRDPAQPVTATDIKAA